MLQALIDASYDQRDANGFIPAQRAAPAPRRQTGYAVMADYASAYPPYKHRTAGELKRIPPTKSDDNSPFSHGA